MKVTKKLSALLAFGLAANMAYASDINIVLQQPTSERFTDDGKVVYSFPTQTILNSAMCNNATGNLIIEFIVRPHAGWSTAVNFEGRTLNPTENKQIFYQYTSIKSTDNSFSVTPRERAKDWSFRLPNASLGLNINEPTLVYQPSTTDDSNTIYRDGKFNVPKMLLMYIDYTCHERTIWGTKGRPIEGSSGHINLYIGNIDINPRPKKTCRLTSAKDQVVNLKTITTTNLRNNNEVAAGNFDLTLDCERNTNVQAVYVGFVDATDKTNTSTTLTLTKDSTAKGVGLKLYANNTGQVIKYNPNVESEVSLNKNDAYRLELDRTSGIANASYSVSYVKTSENVTSGSVKGITTFNFYYQ